MVLNEFLIREWLKEKKHKLSPWGEKLDANGYAKSLWDTHEDECLLCHKRGPAARHEIFFGTADRPTSKATGCWCYLCPRCHDRIHSDYDYDMALKISTQFRFEQSRVHNFDWGPSHSHEEFMALFGENYL